MTCKYCGTLLTKADGPGDECIYCWRAALLLMDGEIKNIKKIMTDHCTTERLDEIIDAARKARYVVAKRERRESEVMG